jgi:hypothetical protein
MTANIINAGRQHVQCGSLSTKFSRMLQQRSSSNFRNPFGGNNVTSGGRVKGQVGIPPATSSSGAAEPELFFDIGLTDKAAAPSNLKSKKRNKLFQHFKPVYLTTYLANKEKNVVKYIKLFDLYGEHLLSQTPLEKKN